MNNLKLLPAILAMSILTSPIATISAMNGKEVKQAIKYSKQVVDEDFTFTVDEFPIYNWSEEPHYFIGISSFPTLCDELIEANSRDFVPTSRDSINITAAAITLMWKYFVAHGIKNISPVTINGWADDEKNTVVYIQKARQHFKDFHKSGKVKLNINGQLYQKIIMALKDLELLLQKRSVLVLDAVQEIETLIKEI